MKNFLYVLAGLTLFLIHAYPAGRPYYHFKQLSIREGLPTSILSLYDDKKGSLWVGTTQGVYRFNGEKIKKYPLPARLRTSTHYIYSLQGDSHGRIWVATSRGISYYTYEQDSLQVLLRYGRSVKASVVVPEGDNLLIPVTDTLLVYAGGLQFCEAIPLGASGTRIIGMQPYDSRRYLVIDSRWEMKLLDKRTGEFTAAPFGDTSGVNSLFRDSSGRYWVSYYGQGVTCYTGDGRLAAVYNTRNSGLSNDIVLDMAEWDGAIWLATDGGGVNIVYPDSRDVQVLSNRENRFFPANSVSCLCRSDTHMWIGMVREGVLGAEKGFITTYTKAGRNPAFGLSDKCPLCLWEDTAGRLWIGTDGGGIDCFDPVTERFTHYPQTAGEKVVSLCPLSDTELLVSSFSKGLFRFNKETGAYRPFLLPDRVAERNLSGAAPTNLRVNSRNEIELYGNAFYRYQPATRRLIPIRPDIGPVQSSWIYIGSYRSHPYFHDRSNVFRYNRETDKYEMIVCRENNQVLAAVVDTAGTLWIAGPDGVERLTLSSGRKEKVKLPDGNDVVTSLVTDPEGMVWMGALGVIYAYDPRKNHFVIYNEMDGVLPNDFLAKPVWATHNGNVYMGGSEGLVRINKALKPDAPAPFLSLQLQEVSLNGRAVPLSETTAMKIAGDFASLQIRVRLDGENAFHKRIYRFRIRGLNREYIETSRPHLTLHTLSPGDYRITAQCTQNDGNRSPEFTVLRFTVLPPWWRQSWFVALCAAVGIVSAVCFVRVYRKRLQQKYREQERTVYKEKVCALININHELRTPLTLIYTPLKQLITSRQVPRALRTQLHGAFKQARQMKNLIDMILNLRKMEVEECILRMAPASFNEWLAGILDDFKTEFSLRRIDLRFVPDPAIQTLFFDPVQCEIIVTNLLTNAYKFSEENASVTVSTFLEDGGTRIRVTVEDEGVGLRPEDRENLFTRFYQGNHTLQGTGIGLSYARQLLEMHGGFIGARNNERKGATFFFTLPYRQEAANIRSTPQPYINRMAVAPADTSPKQPKPDTDGKFHSILIVEDDRDLCDFLICHLQALFEEVYEAHDGLEALPVIASRAPQLVLSDVKMPRMNGFELCRHIKQKPESSCIPVILLTSCVDDASMEAGYEAGAEAYVTKPFDLDLLTVQIRNILHNRNSIKKQYAVAHLPVPLQKQPDYAAEQWRLRFNRIIGENIGNSAMDVHFIAREMNMSRALLYSKARKMLGVGVSEYIIKCRLEYACRLLQTTALSVGEVAEQSGFKHPRNFSTLFKNTFGTSPSEYRKAKGGKSEFEGGRTGTEL